MTKARVSDEAASVGVDRGLMLGGTGGEWAVAGPGGVVDVRLHGARIDGAIRGRTIAQQGDRRRRRPDPTGRVTALRSARSMPAVPQPIELVVALTEIGPAAGGFPLAAAATAALTGVVAALFFSPLFALLAGVSVLAVVGRWMGARRHHRRSVRERQRDLDELVVAWAQKCRSWATDEERARRQRSLSPDGLVEIATGATSPWWERLSPGGAVAVSVGTGSLEATVPVAAGAVPVADGVGLVEGCDPAVTLVDVPIEVEIDPGLAVCGDRSEALAATRWLVASILARVGPADLGVVLVTTADRVVDWDSMKWSLSVAACVVVADQADDALAEAFEAQSDARRPMLVLVDGAQPRGPGPLARVLSGRVDETMVIWLGGDEDVPAGCRARLLVRPDRSGQLERLDDGSVTTLCWFGLEEADWCDLMRWIGGFEDPEAPVEGGGLPSAVALGDLVAGRDAAGRDAAGLDSAALVGRGWPSASAAALRCRLGEDREGAVEIDLVADGPHALVAGTTGAGKSELLRTLVVGLAVEQPPELVSFVLIDFKGGGAFDLVAPLPHVAAVVTDLDPAEASRALRGLRAEILDRERRLRDMELSDVSDIDRSHPRAFGRLVVVVDEFAALAEELPEFLDGLVDIARRGRSLGVHLVLATQRPSGVVSGQIRANSNLRLCLRVQDRGDSIDVVDDPVAGLLPPIPGRAVLRRGGGRCEHLQVAQVSGKAARPSAEVFRLHPAVPVTREAEQVVAVLDQALARASSAAGSAGDRSLIDQIVTAADGHEPARAPWVEAPRRAAFPVVDADASPGRVAVGLLDDPDRRTVRPFRWEPMVDGLLVVGADERQIAKTAATAVAAALDDRSVPTFVLDGDRSGAQPLRCLGSVSAVIDVIGVDEPERLLRAVEQLERAADPRLVVVHQWAAIAEALQDLAGALAVERLAKLVRRAGSPDSIVVVTARSDRDVPQRVSAGLGARVIHRLADPAGFMSFGLRAMDGAAIEGSSFVDPSSGLVGVIAEIGEPALAALGNRVMRDPKQRWPEPIRVLGDRVDRTALPPVEVTGDGWRVPVGLDIELVPYWVTVGERRPVVVVGHPGAGRTTAVTTIAAAVGGELCVIDDIDRRDDTEVAALVAEARAAGRAIVAGCTPAGAKRFGSAVSELVAMGTVVLLNPGRNDGELVRLPVPDLSDQPVGRAVAVDRGRATVVQIAA